MSRKPPCPFARGSQIAWQVDPPDLLFWNALGADVRQAVDNAYRGVVKIKFDGAGYRSDIAHRALARLDAQC